MAKPSFAVVGNCQARPLSQLFGLMMPEWRHAGDVVVQNARAEGEAADLALIARADLVFAQLVQDDFAARHLATSRLRERFGDRVVVWPNAFFNGQTPDTFYISTDAGRAVGPLGEYHSLLAFLSWSEGLDVEACLRRMEDEEGEDADLAKRRAAFWLRALEQREARCDVAISDFIAAHWRDQRLFHVFNHPVSRLMVRLASRLLKAAGHKPAAMPTPYVVGEPLAVCMPPVPPGQARALGLRYPVTSFARGREVTIGEGGAITPGAQRVWALGDLVEASYRCYDARPELRGPVRFTPHVRIARAEDQ